MGGCEELYEVILLILPIDPWPDQDEMKTLTPNTVSLFDSLNSSYTDLQADRRLDRKELAEAWRTSPAVILPDSELQPLPLTAGRRRH